MIEPAAEIPLRRFLAGLAIVLTLAGALRAVYPTADPPWGPSVGITWHDEGPWVHNARNKALWGTWSTDRWNPMYLTPVFTALEYAAFECFGVGLWQARSVSVAMGLISIVMVAFGVLACSDRRTALVAAALLATNHAWVQWNRVALLETTMVAFMAVAWGAYALAERRAWWGGVAGLAAVMALYSKAAAAFFIVALGTEALLSVALALGLDAKRLRRDRADGDGAAPRMAPALWTLAGLAIGGTLFLVWFVLPNWAEVRFYNWQMSVTRKPSYGLGAFVDRATWVPVVNAFFTRMWPVTLVAVTACLALLTRWRTAKPAERLLGLWVALGIAELVVHDAGNERRLVLLIPVLIILAALVLGRSEPVLPPSAVRLSRRDAALAVPAVLYAAYIVCGALARVAFGGGVRASVWAGGVGAVVMCAAVYSAWPRLVRWLSTVRPSARTVASIVVVLMAVDLAQFWHWASTRTYKNVESSRLLGEWLPPGTLVHGKLANGLALDNRIKPVFIGRQFGNYDDRYERDDVRYLVTYVSPWYGYEGAVIRDVLTGCPGWRILKTFDVAETATGHDRAALILKAPRCAAAPTRSPSAKD